MRDDDRAGCGRPPPSLEDQRRWGYDPEVDRYARGLARDGRRSGEDLGPCGGGARVDGAGVGPPHGRGGGVLQRPPDRRAHAPGDSYGGWSRAGSMQGGRTEEGPRGDDVRAPPPDRRLGPNGGRRSVRLSRDGSGYYG